MSRDSYKGKLFVGRMIRPCPIAGGRVLGQGTIVHVAGTVDNGSELLAAGWLEDDTRVQVPRRLVLIHELEWTGGEGAQTV